MNRPTLNRMLQRPMSRDPDLVAFDAAALTRDYDFLGACPDHLMDEVVELPVGSLRDRVTGIGRWRSALLDGHLPSETAWPPPAIAAPIRKALESLSIARYCKGEPTLVDALLRDVLAAVRAQSEVVRAEVAARLDELVRLERKRLQREEAEGAEREERRRRAVRIHDEHLRELQARAESEVASRTRPTDAGLVGGWNERVRAWSEIADVFGDLGNMLGRGWDLARGALRHTGWLDLLRLRQLLEGLPELKEIVRALGRLQVAQSELSIAEQIMQPVQRLEEERLEILTDGAPEETRGIERSGDIARMLPVEALMLGHPTLRYLWHARRAERALLTYRVQGVMTEPVWTETTSQESIESKAPRRDRGPIVAVIDTSGSMHGLPERVAKALVLEAARTAHTERRRCFLYTYSGPGEVATHELDLSPDGLGRLLTFLGSTFGGGTDVTMLTTVTERLRKEEWSKADVILVSDGEWPASQEVISAVKAAKERGSRFHGVLVGNAQSSGMRSLCDPMHVFLDWASAGGWSD